MPDARLIVVVGAGGHAKVIVDFLRLSGWEVIGCTDQDVSKRECVGAPVLGDDEILPKLRREGVQHAFCALGDNTARERVGQRLLSIGFDLPPLVGTGAFISATASVSPGAAILGGAVVNVDCSIGSYAIINTNANIDHDCVIGTAAHIGPGANLAGDVHVGDRSFVATGSSVIPKIRIGRDSIIGAGSVVVSSIPDSVVAYGNPATLRRKVM